MTPIRGDLSIAFRTVADGAHRPNRRRKINLTGKKGFPVFPKGLKSVNVEKLNFSAALLTRGRARLLHHRFRLLVRLGYFTKVNSLPR
jgi:hypothetical protein